MFGFLKDRQILEQKKMLWQNLFGSKDIIELLKKRRSHYPVLGERYKETNERIISKLSDIEAMATAILNSRDYKVKLDKERLNYLWQDNKALRGIYAEHLKSHQSGTSFDDFVNPPYGWETALKDWN